MKRTIAILMLIMGVAFAQNSDKATSRLSEQEILYRSFQTTAEALRFVMIDDSSGTSDSLINMLENGTYKFPGGENYGDVRNTWDWSRYIGNFWDTTSAYTDTISPGSSTVWWSFTITTDDTILISDNSAFTTPARKVSAMILLPTETLTYDKMNIAYTPRYYYKSYGTSGNPLVRVYWKGF